MLKLHRGLPKAKTPHERESVRCTIAATDKSIDALVYELHGLTQAEIRVAEGAADGFVECREQRVLEIPPDDLRK